MEYGIIAERQISYFVFHYSNPSSVILFHFSLQTFHPCIIMLANLVITRALNKARTNHKQSVCDM